MKTGKDESPTPAGAEASFLAGKVLKRSLPAIQGPPGPGAPRLKRLLLAQGELAHCYDGEAGIQYIAVMELRAGSRRGNHYHQVKEEWLYVLEGKVMLTVEDLGSRERATLTLQAGDLAFIATRVAHVLETVESGQAIEFSPARFDAADVYPFRLP